MRQVMVRYRVRPEHTLENERDVRKVFEELALRKPASLWYASFKVGDNVSFVHVVADDSGDRPHPLSEILAFKAFAAAIERRCDEQPIVTELTEVGSYNMFGD